MMEMSNLVQIRRQIKTVVAQTDTAMRDDVIKSVAEDMDIDETRVDSELDTLEKDGFAYLVNGEVRLP